MRGGDEGGNQGVGVKGGVGVSHHTFSRLAAPISSFSVVLPNGYCLRVGVTHSGDPTIWGVGVGAALTWLCVEVKTKAGSIERQPGSSSR